MEVLTNLTRYTSGNRVTAIRYRGKGKNSPTSIISRIKRSFIRSGIDYRGRMSRGPAVVEERLGYFEKDAFNLVSEEFKEKYPYVGLTTVG